MTAFYFRVGIVQNITKKMSTKFNRIISFETPSEHKSICLWNSSVDSYQNFMAIHEGL